jgi:hypothetical protein
MLIFKYIPKTIDQSKHSAERIRDVLLAELENLLGPGALSHVLTAVVDGGSNVTKASRLLLGLAQSRRCEMHALQTVLKYIIVDQADCAGDCRGQLHGVALQDEPTFRTECRQVLDGNEDALELVFARRRDGVRQAQETGEYIMSTRVANPPSSTSSTTYCRTAAFVHCTTCVCCCDH